MPSRAPAREETVSTPIRPRPHRRATRAPALPPRGAQHEPLAQFLREIHDTPVLTAAQEVALARTMRTARSGLRAALAQVPGAARRLLCAWREREAKAWVPELLSERYEQGAQPPPELARLARELGEWMPRALRCTASPSRSAARERAAACFERFDPRTPLLIAWSRELDAAAAETGGPRRRFGLARGELAAWAREAALHREEYLGARRTFAQHNLRLVVHIAKDFQGQGAALSDLVQEGNVALLRAVEKFDDRRGFRFSTYAGWWIVQALQRGTRRDASLISLPDDLLADRRSLLAREARIVARTGASPSFAELARDAGLSAKRLARLAASPTRAVALDAPLSPHDERSAGDVLADESAPDPAQRIDGAVRASCVQRLLADIAPRERYVLTARFGLGGAPERTLQELADELGLSRERIRQIEKEALAHLGDRAAGLGLA